MMKAILTTLFAIATFSLMAQDIDDIRKMAGKNDWVKAKDAIDKYLANEKNAKKAEGWFLKAQIYNGIARDSSSAALVTDGRQDAFQAYKKYLEIDPQGKEGIINQHSPLFDIAFGYLDKASSSFNSKKFDQALINFRAAEPVEEYISKKGFAYGTFAFPAYDTQLYLNVAASAINAKKEDIAVEYYQKIADKKIKDKGFDEIYRYLVDYYDRKNDKANTDKYLAIGRELYPTDEYWCEVGMKGLEDDKKKLFAHYETLLGGPCDNYFTRYNYAVEMYNYAYVGDNAPADRAAIQKRIEEVLSKGIEMKADGVEANMLMTRHHFAIIKYLGEDYDAIKGTKPEDVKKKNDINAQINKKYDDAYPYINKLFTYFESKGSSMKTSEKGQFKIIGSMMVEYWESKKDKVKMKEYQDKVKAFD